MRNEKVCNLALIYGRIAKIAAQFSDGLTRLWVRYHVPQNVFLVFAKFTSDIIISSCGLWSVTLVCRKTRNLVQPAGVSYGSIAGLFVRFYHGVNRKLFRFDYNFYVKYEWLF